MGFVFGRARLFLWLCVFLLVENERSVRGCVARCVACGFLSQEVVQKVLFVCKTT